MCEKCWETNMSNLANETLLDTLIHSNPCESDLPLLKKGQYDSTIEYCQQFPFPKSSSDATKDELRYIISQSKDPILREQASLNRYMDIDTNPVQTFCQMINSFLPDSEHEKVIEMVSDIYPKVEPIAIRLKYFYNRPRPCVLAAYYKAPLFANESIASIKPSYPSLRVMAAAVIASVMSSKYPEITDDLSNMVHYVSVSRIVLGLNYMSDIEMSQIAAGKLISENEFSAIYGI